MHSHCHSRWPIHAFGSSCASASSRLLGKSAPHSASPAQVGHVYHATRHFSNGPTCKHGCCGQIARAEEGFGKDTTLTIMCLAWRISKRSYWGIAPLQPSPAPYSPLSVRVRPSEATCHDFLRWHGWEESQAWDASYAAFSSGH